MGIDLHQGTSFPVGKVDLMNLYPLSYKEFLLATKQIDALKDYYFVGGMPEAVQHFVSHPSYDEVRNIHTRMLLDYGIVFQYRFLIIHMKGNVVKVLMWLLSG